MKEILISLLKYNITKKQLQQLFTFISYNLSNKNPINSPNSLQSVSFENQIEEFRDSVIENY